MRGFVDAVARDEMTREILGELFPPSPVLRRRNVLFVPEGVERVRIRGKLFRGEAELDKWADVILKQAVVDLIHVGKVVDRLAVVVLVVEAGFVVEDSVETDIFEAGNAFCLTEGVAIAFAEAQDGAARTEHFLPEVGGGVCSRG